MERFQASPKVTQRLIERTHSGLQTLGASSAHLPAHLQTQVTDYPGGERGKEKKEESLRRGMQRGKWGLNKKLLREDILCCIELPHI